MTNLTSHPQYVRTPTPSAAGYAQPPQLQPTYAPSPSTGISPSAGYAPQPLYPSGGPVYPPRPTYPSTQPIYTPSSAYLPPGAAAPSTRYDPMSYFASGANRPPVNGPINGPINGGPAVPTPGSIYGGGSYAPPATVTPPAVKLNSAVSAPAMAPQSLAQQALAAKSAAETVPVKLPSRPAKEEKREFYDVEFDSSTHSESSIRKLTEYERFCEPVECVSSDFYASGGWIVVSTHRLILLTKDKTGGVFWPLKTTEFVNVEGGFFKGNSFVFQSTVANAQKRTLKLTSAKDGQLLHALFTTNQQFHEYDTLHVRNRNNILAVFNEECETVIRFADALSVCSSNANALFIWLLSVVGFPSMIHERTRCCRW